MPVNKEVGKKQENCATDLNPEGIRFIGQHKLKLILSDEFIPPEERPWIDATNGAVKIMETKDMALCSGCVSVEHLLDGLAKYDKRAHGPLANNVTYLLPEQEVMEVKFGNIEWYRMFLTLDHLFPGSVIWPEKK